jgi:hypothetical protein
LKEKQIFDQNHKCFLLKFVKVEKNLSKIKFKYYLRKVELLSSKDFLIFNFSNK